MTKLEELGKIWVKWNIHELSGDRAMCMIKELFPIATMREWRKFCKQRDEELGPDEC